MATDAQVGVVGLKALQNDLKRMGDAGGALAKGVQNAGRLAAAPVAQMAASMLPHVTGRLAGDVRVTASKTGAAVRVGRSSVPYAGPVEFGGYPGDRAYLPQGRYLYPAARTLADTAAATYSDALEKVFAEYSWTNAGTDGGAIHD